MKNLDAKHDAQYEAATARARAKAEAQDRVNLKNLQRKLKPWAENGACPCCLAELLDQLDMWPTAHTAEVASVIESVIAQAVQNNALAVVQGMVGRELHARDEVPDSPHLVQ